MKRFLYCFTTMLLVLAITDAYLEGAIFRPEIEQSVEMTARPSSINLTGGGIPKYEEIPEPDNQELGEIIAAESRAFVEAVFRGDSSRVAAMLYQGTEYKVVGNKSSYIRYASEDMHVEGYMATDKKLLRVRHCWYVKGDDGTITSGVEVEIEGDEGTQTWYIHYRKILGRWKIFMVENGL